MSLIEELSKPEYATMVANKDYDGLEQLLNNKNISTPILNTFITELGVLDLLGPTDGEVFLSSLESAAAGLPVLNRVIRWLRTEKGVDVGNQQVQTVLLQLVAVNIINEDSANTIIAYATKNISIAEKENLGIVGHGTLYNTLKEMGV